MMDNSYAEIELVPRFVIQSKKTHWNLTPPLLYEEIVKRGEAMISEKGSIVIYTGKSTGRSPHDKFYVHESPSQEHIWWGKDNKPLDPVKFESLKARITEYFSRQELYIQDCYGGADPLYRFPARIITDTAWQSLFAYNMFRHAENVLPKNFAPQFTVLVASGFEAEPAIDGTRSDVVVAINLEQKIALIVGTCYAGEIKKTVFTVLNYLYPLQGILPMHCAANIGADGQSALFFGLSGTGKTTLSSNPKRHLIGDDEHGWSDRGIFNFEGGCYAKVIRLSNQDEPQIYAVTRHFGTILENVVIDPQTREIDLDDDSITENTRASYILSEIENHEPSGLGGHPKDIVFLTTDAFGVLPPISRLTPDQAIYHFLSGYTAKVAGTEKGVIEPQATFSSCFGEPFMVHHPMVYARLLAKKIYENNSCCWLVNTGWTGGPYGVGTRMKIAYTRAMVDALLLDALADVVYDVDPFFGLLYPKSCPGVPAAVLNPRHTWPNSQEYDQQAHKLAGMFVKNFEKYSEGVSAEVIQAGPKG
ncbi:MAG: phosphoenolpyruvate carboxykinase (ATP) [Anaerolineaceae bacterium]|jgi:phosphoenolpyruvate carboxykinase (ATP)